MKKIFAIILCVLMIAAVPTVAFAEEISTEPTENLPTENETATEGEISASETDTPITETLVSLVKSNLETITFVGGVIVYIIFGKRTSNSLTGSMGKLNNNAITIAKDSADTINNALVRIEAIENRFNKFGETLEIFLAEIRQSAEEKKRLVETLNHVESFLKTAKLATLELSNEVAELLVLANIPNSKKNELYARHQKAVREIEAAEGVISNDGT